ncbi:MAG: tetratricopeptide repeat protein [Candidatus Cloacimonadaceae bacterium]|nr:tetratricopeptide repeat protein [Candidatus Cloacimonadaceae bacterium]MDP3115197.1 tetratricopeptide repeat protein [Candidatus Cloacimonadaceae bacterium]
MNDIELGNLILRAEALMKSNWLHGYHLLLQAAQEHPDDPRGWLSLGDFYHGRSRHEEAIKAYQSALRLQPKDNQLQTVIGNCYFAMGDYRIAIIYYDQVINPSPEVGYNKALALAYQGKHRESIAIMKDLLDLIDNNPFIYFLLVEQLLRVSDYAAAQRYLKKAEARIGKHKHIMLLKAITYAKQEIWLTAYHAFNEYMQSGSLQLADHMLTFALCALNIGMPNRSIEILESAVLENPYKSQLYEELVRLLIAQNKRARAREVLKIANDKLSSMNPVLKLLQARLGTEYED